MSDAETMPMQGAQWQPAGATTVRNSRPDAVATSTTARRPGR